MEKGFSFTHTQLCCRDLEYARSMGDRKGYLPSMSFYVWVGWLLQHRTIDGPARQGVLVWDEVCQVGVWVLCLQPPAQV